MVKIDYTVVAGTGTKNYYVLLAEFAKAKEEVNE